MLPLASAEEEGVGVSGGNCGRGGGGGHDGAGDALLSTGARPGRERGARPGGDRRALARGTDRPGALAAAVRFVSGWLAGLLNAVLQMLVLVPHAVFAAFALLQAVLYPLIEVVPPHVWSAIGQALFRVGYLVYLTRVGQWLHDFGVWRWRRRPEQRKKMHSVAVVPNALATCDVVVVPMLSDNYCYVVIDRATRQAALVDASVPYDALKVATTRGADVTMQLVTHRHWDHAGGVRRVRAKVGTAARVVAPRGECVPLADTLLVHGDRVSLGATTLVCIETPCHTPHHCVYAIVPAPDAPLSAAECVFTGDALFSGGVGAFFHGTAADCYAYTHGKLDVLPGSCKVFCGHEYTLTNARFATWLETTNASASGCSALGIQENPSSALGGGALGVNGAGINGVHGCVASGGSSGSGCGSGEASEAMASNDAGGAQEASQGAQKATTGAQAALRQPGGMVAQPRRMLLRGGDRAPGSSVLVGDDSSPVAKRLSWVVRRRALGLTTMPSTMQIERDTNPFLRADDMDFRSMVAERLQGLREDWAGIDRAVARARRECERCVEAGSAEGDKATSAELSPFLARSGVELTRQLTLLLSIYRSSPEFAAAPKACCEAGVCVRHRSCAGVVWSPDRLAAAIAQTRQVMFNVQIQLAPTMAVTNGMRANGTGASARGRDAGVAQAVMDATRSPLTPPFDHSEELPPEAVVVEVETNHRC